MKLCSIIIKKNISNRYSCSNIITNDNENNNNSNNINI